MPSEDHHEDAMTNVISVVRKGDSSKTLQRNQPQPYSATDRIRATGSP